MTAEFRGLSKRLKDTYRNVEGGPSEEQISEAFATLKGAWDQVAESVSVALRDPEVRQHVKNAASSLASALGTTISELGAELKREDQAAESFGQEEE